MVYMSQGGYTKEAGTVMFVPQDGTFEYKGRRYVVKRQPQRMWPCQQCGLADVCADACGSGDFPSCRKEARKDRTNVIFCAEPSKLRRDSSRCREARARYE